MLEEYWHYAAFALVAFTTSTITGALGMGGGLLLLAILPSFLPVNAIIPIHGAVQLASNASRFLLRIKDLCIQPFAYFTAGGCIGAVLGWSVLDHINLSYIPILLSVFILLLIWTSLIDALVQLPGKYFSLGILQTAISVFVGAAGPLSTTWLLKDNVSRNRIITTSAANNAIINLMKLIVYTLVGFVFSDYLMLVLVMAIMAIVGTYVGVEIRDKINQDTGKTIIKVLITLICVKNILNFILAD